MNLFLSDLKSNFNQIQALAICQNIWSSTLLLIKHNPKSTVLPWKRTFIWNVTIFVTWWWPVSGVAAIGFMQLYFSTMASERCWILAAARAHLTRNGIFSTTRNCVQILATCRHSLSGYNMRWSNACEDTEPQEPVMDMPTAIMQRLCYLLPYLVLFSWTVHYIVTFSVNSSKCTCSRDKLFNQCLICHIFNIFVLNIWVKQLLCGRALHFVLHWKIPNKYLVFSLRFTIRS